MALVSKKNLALQARKPSGFLGKYVVQPMFVAGNHSLNQAIVSHLSFTEEQRFLEIGCGPGVLLRQLCATYPQVQFEAIDFSETMVKQAALRTQDFIDFGQLSIQLGDWLDHPFSSNSFDVIVTSNTIYFWQPPEAYLKEMYHVLKPGGRVFIGFRTEEQMAQMGLDETVFMRYSETSLILKVAQAGFTNIKVHRHAVMPVDAYILVAEKPKTI